MVTTPNPADAPTWYDFVINFDRTKKAFDDNYNALLQLGPQIDQYPGLRDQYDLLVNEGADHYNTLQKLQATRDYAASWLNWLATGATGVFNFFGSSLGLNGVGIAPVIAIVGIASAAAALVAISKWIANAYELAQRLNGQLAIADRYIAGGMPRAQAMQYAARDVNATMGPPPTGEFLGIPFTLLIWGAVAIFLGPPIIKAISGGRN